MMLGGMVSLISTSGRMLFGFFWEKNLEGGEMLFPVCVADCMASATINDFLSYHLLMSPNGTVTE
jgi:hypothetical protein